MSENHLKSLMQKYADYQIKMRRHFHQWPEASKEEFKTAQTIRDELDKAGIEWRECGMPTGTLARIKGAKPGKTILLRGDIDGISVTEETGVEYSSKVPGLMHACGHDCHASMLLTAALMLNELKDEIEGEVVLAFQPAEELCSGAEPMIEDGALDGVDAAFAMHVWFDVPVGTVGLCPGYAMASGDRFEIDIEGKSGHGASPEECIDATVVGAAIVMNLQTIVSRELLPMNAAVVTVGSLESGNRYNVISGKAKLTGTVRTFKPEVREYILKRIEEIAKGTAETLRAKAEFATMELSPCVNNDAAIMDIVWKASQKVMGEEAPYTNNPTMGCEDFAYFQQKVPGVMAFLGIRNEACGACWAQHHSKYNVDESALIKGAGLYVQTALDFLKS